jgi:hypothetical protein
MILLESILKANKQIIEYVPSKKKKHRKAAEYFLHLENLKVKISVASMANEVKVL